jgi:hypothetical protein
VTKSIHRPGRQADAEQGLFRGSAPRQIWQNPLNPDSLRLTSQAYSILTKYENNKNYPFKFEVAMTNRMLLQLDHLMTAPYYIGSRKQIQLFGEADAIMLQLHSNNLAQYLENLANQQE